MSFVSIIVPTLNEQGNIVPLLNRIFSVASPETTEVIFVDDDSGDSTRDEIEGQSDVYPVRLIHRREGRGLSSAVMAGAECASGDILVVMDADLSHPPEVVPELVDPIAEGRAEVVVGSRYMDGGATEDWTLSRKIISRGATWLARPFTHVSDPMSGFFAVKKEALSGREIQASGFKIGLEILAAGGDGFRVEEVPFTFCNRQVGESKLGAGVMGHYLAQLVRLGLQRAGRPEALLMWLPWVLACLADVLVTFSLTWKGVALPSAQLAGFGAMVAAWLSGNCLPGLKGLSPRQKALLPAGCFVMLFLRGGLLLSAQAAMPLLPSLLLTDFIVCVFSAAVLSHHALPDHTPYTMRLFQWLIAVTLLLKLGYMGHFELLHQEAYYWNYAMHPALGYLDHPPMTAWLIGLSTRILGNSELAVRMGALLGWGVAAGFVFLLTRRVAGKGSAVASLVPMAALPFTFGIGFLMTPDAPLAAAWAGALYFLFRAVVEKAHKAWFGVGVCVGIGMLSKYTIVLLGPATFVYLMLDRDSRRLLLRPEPWLAIAVALAIFSPVILWNVQNDWASFAFQGSRRFSGGFHFSLPKQVLYAMALLTPAGLWAFASLLFKAGRNRLGFAGMNRPAQRFFLTYTLVPLGFFVAFSLFRSVKLNWTGPIWLAVLPLAAMALSTSHAERRKTTARLWWRMAVGVTLIFGGLFYYTCMGIPGIPYPQNRLLLGWKGLGQEIETVSDRIAREIGSVPLVVGMDKYRTASGLAFYRTLASGGRGGEDTARPFETTSGSHHFGKNSLMYRFWFPEEVYGARRMLVVSQDREDVVRALASGGPDGSERPVESIALKKNGKPAGVVYYGLTGDEPMRASIDDPQRSTEGA